MSAPKSDAPARSPLSGCLIMIIAVLVMVFLVVFSIFTLFRQADAIEKFTDEKAQPVQVAAVTPEQLTDLTSRTRAFGEALKQDKPAELAITADDFNRAIASYEPLKDLKGTFFVEEISSDYMRVAIAYQMNGKPRLAREGESGGVVSDPRFLNAKLTVRPVLTKGQLVLLIDRIDAANGAAVPDQFRELMSPYRITDRYLSDKEIGPLMAKLTGADIKDGKLVLRRKDGETPPDTITNEQVDFMSGKFFKVLGFAACGFLVLVGLLLVVALRKKAQQNPE